ncbi:MAG: hypothetical protein M3Y83_14460 [Actinomycetota bacterium]|nr:hypothetical protein [Actinomycetota bacterium]
MSMFRKLADAFRDFNTAFGLAPLHDVDLPDDPTDRVVAALTAHGRQPPDFDVIEAHLVETIAVLQVFVDAIRAAFAEPQLPASITDLDQRRQKGRQP